MLAIHPGAFGDVLLAIPALRALRAQAPGAGLALAAQPRVGALLEALGVVDAHRPFDALGLDALFVDDPTALPRLPPAARVVCWFGARDPVFVRRLREQAPGAIVAPSAGHGLVWAHLLDTIGAPPGDWCGPIAAPAALREIGRAALGAAGWEGRRPLAVVHPGAGGRAKRWPAEGFARALEALRGEIDVAVHQGPADTDAVAALRACLTRPVRVLEEPTLDALAGALAHATAYLGNDSGPSHLAAALGVPSVVLYGEPNLAWRPWSRAVRVAMVRTDRVEPADVERVAAALAPLAG